MERNGTEWNRGDQARFFTRISYMGSQLIKDILLLYSLGSKLVLFLLMISFVFPSPPFVLYLTETVLWSPAALFMFFTSKNVQAY